MINETLQGMMGTKIMVVRGHNERRQFRFPRSKRRRIRKKWSSREKNWRERYVPPPMADDEFIVMNGPNMAFPYDPNRKDAGQTTAGPQTIICTPAGEATLRQSLGITA